MIRRWLMAHPKNVALHGLILCCFLLFMVFLADPLFDRFEKIPGESRLHKTTLPAVTNNIQYCNSSFEVTTHILEINGWAFIEDYDSVNNEIYIVLKSVDRTYVFTTETMLREGVTQHFKEMDLNLDYSGYTALIPVRKIASGEYTVGIYITKGDIEALQYTDKVLVK